MGRLFGGSVGIRRYIFKCCLRILGTIPEFYKILLLDTGSASSGIKFQIFAYFKIMIKSNSRSISVKNKPNIAIFLCSKIRYLHYVYFLSEIDLVILTSITQFLMEIPMIMVQNRCIIEWPSILRIVELGSVTTISAYSKILLLYKYIKIL